ncbi:START domain-containing protein [Rufibacter sp. XAAS-G3-1]|uniref:START domain-containing protein n=1 Tax=Rufibacter sp. XAAS-G3-1 TaxID=2729134 RepID=UPI0015E73EAA|nr:START domain-containing protein [Rufibacter sp. XAAS-G3-1]
MKRPTLFLLLLWLGLGDSPGALAQENWELQKNQDGIAVYTKQLENASVKQIKVVCELPGTTANLVNLLKNVEHHSDWVYLNRKTTLLKRKSENALIYYTEADMPWPLDDRDLVVEATFSPITKNNTARVEVRSLSGFLPVKKGFVRIPSSLATWEITQLPGNKIKVEYLFTVNPGGSVPAWLVNATVAVGPHKTFQNLRGILAKMAKEQAKQL